jgi:hypothetical protein
MQANLNQNLYSCSTYTAITHAGVARVAKPPANANAADDIELVKPTEFDDYG